MDDSDFQIALTLYSQETKRLESAYESLQKQFYELKDRLETSHQTLEQIVSHLAEGLLFITQNGVISMLNPAAEQLLGISYETVFNTSYWEHFSDYFFGFSMRAALLQPGAHKRIFLNFCHDQEIEVSTSSIPAKGMLLLLTNRKERETLERSLNQLERLQELGEMAATLAHEIRNPLGGIEGFAQLLKRDLKEPDQQRMIKAILEGTRTLNHLVTQVLDYARPLQSHFAPTDLVTLLYEAIELASASTNTPKCSLVIAREHFSLLLDSQQIKLVLWNLLRNAFQAKATLVEIHLTNEGTLIVKDNGEGIEAKNLKKIFTPFFTTKADGTGLGLAQAAAVVKAHGGTLEVSSEKGKGTQFTLILSG